MSSETGNTKKEQEEMNRLALAVMQEIAAGRAVEEIVRDLNANGWPRQAAIEFVEQIEEQWREIEKSPEQRSAVLLQMRFPEMRPVKSMPTLHTVNGIGTSFAGSWGHDSETGTFVKAHCISVIFIPILALGAYRVARASGGGWYVIGRVPLPRLAKLWNWLLVCAVAGLIGWGVWQSYAESSEYQAAAKLARANEAAEAGKLEEASRLYHEVALGATSHSTEAKMKLVALLQRADVDQLPPEKLLAVFRTTDGLSFSIDQRGAVTEQALRQSKRLADGDLAAAFEVLAAIGPTGQQEKIAPCVRSLLGQPLDAARGATVALVIQCVRQILGPPAEEEILQRGFRWLDEHPKEDPHGCLAVADRLGSFSKADPKRVAEIRRKQLERILADDPKDFKAAVLLAEILEKAGEADGVERLLLPHREKLGTGEGARILGQALAAKGKFDDAYGLLGPYLDQRLEKFHAAEKEFEQALEQASNAIVREMNEGHAPGFDYARYRASNEADKQAMVDQYIGQRMANRPEVAAAREKIREQSGVVSAALDLGMVLLQRAQNQNDPKIRQEELQRAEKTFLAVRGVAGNDEQYMLHLGQVYHWLGKQKEGREQFDKLLASRKREYKSLLGVAQVLRTLGAMAEARQMLEEAYGKTADVQEKYGAAHTRAITSVDTTDKIKWLERCDKKNDEIQALLAVTKGEEAAGQGKDEEAAGHYRESIAIHERQTKNATTYNNGALAYLALFEVTGQPETLEQAIQWFDKAVALSPSDAIVLGNAGTALYRSALQDLGAAELNLRELSGGISTRVLTFLPPDQKALTELRRRVREHPGMKKALRYLDQAAVLAPKNPMSYALLSDIHQFLRDEESMRRLAQRIAAAEPDTGAYKELQLKYVRYAQDQHDLDVAAATRRRAEGLVTQRRGSKKAGFAAAVSDFVHDDLLRPDPWAIDADRLVQLADEAHAAAPSCGAYGLRIESLMFRAVKSLRKEFPDFARATETTSRSLPTRYAVLLALAREDALGQAARANKDVRRAAEVAGQMLDAFPEDQGYPTWALLKAVDPKRAEKVAASLAQDKVDALDRQIDLLLAPESATNACREYWARLAQGRKDAREPIQQVIAAGQPFPAGLIDGVEGKQ